MRSRMSQLPEDDLVYVDWLRNYIEPGSTVIWPGTSIQYKIFPISDGWRFEWTKEGQEYSMPDGDEYFLYHFKYKGVAVNGMVWDEWLSSINQPVCEQLNIESLI